jgi:FkbM family methyltransferase
MVTLRNIAERMARGIAVPRRLPRGFGPGRILVSPEAALGVIRWNLESIDPTLFTAVRRLVSPGMKVWDIGANLGLFGFAAAWLAGPQGCVLLVEADPWLCSLLQRSVHRLTGKNYAKAIVASCAIADRAGPVSFAIAARGRASNAISGFGRSQTGGVRETLVVGGATLDQLLEASFRPDVIKIDVEGAELSVLRGALTVLAHRPALLIEVGEQSADEATAVLRAAGYHLYDAETDMRPVERCTWTTVALSS